MPSSFVTNGKIILYKQNVTYGPIESAMEASGSRQSLRPILFPYEHSLPSSIPRGAFLAPPPTPLIVRGVVRKEGEQMASMEMTSEREYGDDAAAARDGDDADDDDDDDEDEEESDSTLDESFRGSTAGSDFNDNADWKVEGLLF